MKSSLMRIATVVATFTVTGAVMASSLVLPSAQSLAGNWQITRGEQQCQVELVDKAQPESNGFVLVDRQKCLKDVVGWRPAPDGIALLQADGSTLAFFSREGEQYRDPEGSTLQALK